MKGVISTPIFFIAMKRKRKTISTLMELAKKREIVMLIFRFAHSRRISLEIDDPKKIPITRIIVAAISWGDIAISFSVSFWRSDWI